MVRLADARASSGETLSEYCCRVYEKMKVCVDRERMSFDEKEKLFNCLLVFVNFLKEN